MLCGIFKLKLSKNDKLYLFLILSVENFTKFITNFISIQFDS